MGHEYRQLIIKPREIQRGRECTIGHVMFCCQSRKTLMRARFYFASVHNLAKL